MARSYRPPVSWTGTMVGATGAAGTVMGAGGKPGSSIGLVTPLEVGLTGVAVPDAPALILRHTADGRHAGERGVHSEGAVLLAGETVDVRRDGPEVLLVGELPQGHANRVQAGPLVGLGHGRSEERRVGK